MANYDLLCAVTSTFAVMGAGYARAALERYGLDDNAIGRVFTAVNRTRSSKFVRYRLRAEFIARGLLSRLRHRDGRRAVAPSVTGRPDASAARGMRATKRADSDSRSAAPS